MNILILLILVGAGMVALALVLFAWTVVARTFDQTDRLALLPLDDEPRDSEHALPSSDVVAPLSEDGATD